MEKIVSLFENEAQKVKPSCSHTESLSVLKKSTIIRLVDEVNAQYGTHADGNKIAKMAVCFTLHEVADVIVEFPHMHKRQVIRLFERLGLVNKTAKMDSSAITRPLLIDLVEMLEEYTGMKITDDSDAPLAYLDQKCDTLDIEDIGDFFSGRKNSRIKSIIDNVQNVKPLLDNKTVKKSFNSRKKVKEFIAGCCGIKPDELDENAPISSLKPDVECGGRPHYLVVYWAEGRFNKLIPNEFVEEKSIGELISAFAG